MTIEEAIEWIHSRLPFGSRPGLERVQALLKKINDPQEKVTTIHIAGTNGKGSTVTYLRCLLQELGLKVGTFTSPYIESFNERIAINGRAIEDRQLIQLVEKFQPLVNDLDQVPAVAGITEFETLTAMAFDHFLQEKVDVAIIEVGLGGLLDSTNVVAPILTGITTIGMDHTEILGDTIEAIAQQKAGIIKPEIPVVTGNIVEPALAVIQEQAVKMNSPIYKYGVDYETHYLHPDEEWGEVFDFANEAGKLKHLKIPLLGEHQTENAGMAIELFFVFCQLQGIREPQRVIASGLMHAFWPARMERVSEEPLVILDGAHNDHAMRRLVQNVKKEFKGRRIYFLFSAIRTKNIHEMVELLKQIPRSRRYLTTFAYPKAVDLADLRDLEDEETTIVSLWQFGLAEILEKMEPDDVLIITGSLYFVSQVRELLGELGGNNGA